MFPKKNFILHFLKCHNVINYRSEAIYNYKLEVDSLVCVYVYMYTHTDNNTQTHTHTSCWKLFIAGQSAVCLVLPWTARCTSAHILQCHLKASPSITVVPCLGISAQIILNLASKALFSLSELTTQQELLIKRTGWIFSMLLCLINIIYSNNFFNWSE